MTADADSKSDFDTTQSPIPDSQRRSFLPMELSGEYHYRHVEYTAGGAPLESTAGYRLHLAAKTSGGEGLYGWWFNSDSTGLLLKRVGTGPLDSQGIYIAGTFRGDSLLRDTARLWLPEKPAEGRIPWSVGTRSLSLVSADTTLWIPAEGSSLGWYQDPVTGRIRVQAQVIREVQGKVTTFYALAMGIGLVAYERNEEGLLTASGMLESAFATQVPQRLWP